MANDARVLPERTVTVSCGLSRPYLPRSFASFETIFCICAEESPVRIASAPAKSARIFDGLVMVQSLPLLASVVVMPSWTTSMPSAFD